MKRTTTQVLSVLLFCLASHAAEQTQQKPNVLMIIVDDMNDWVGSLGGHPDVKTPHIDRLAKRGILFTNAHVAAPEFAPVSLGAALVLAFHAVRFARVDYELPRIDARWPQVCSALDNALLCLRLTARRIIDRAPIVTTFQWCTIHSQIFFSVIIIALFSRHLFQTL